MDFAAMKVSLVINISSSGSGNSSNCSRNSAGSGSGSDVNSGCGSNVKIFTWTGKYKLGTIDKARVGKYNIGTRASKCKVFVRVSKHRLSDRAGKYKLGFGPINTNWGQDR